MKHLSDIFLLSNSHLYEPGGPVLQSELSLVKGWGADLDNVMKEVREKYN